MSTLLGLTTAGGGLLISSGTTKEIEHKLLLSAFVVFVIVMFILTALHALQVETAQHDWARPNAGRFVQRRAGLGEEFDLDVLASLLAAAEHNALIADWKNDELRQARNTFRIGLWALVLIPIALLFAILVRFG